MNGPFKKISELATVIPGFSPKPDERKRDGRYILVGGRNIKGGKLVKTDVDSYVDELNRESFRRAIAVPGDIIVSTLFDRRKLYVYSQEDPPAVINNSCAIIRSGQSGDYIVSYLRTMEGQRDFLDKATRATRGNFIPRLSVRDLAEIQVPILPIAELARLGDARIEKSTNIELIELKKELESKDVEIARLKAQNEGMERFYLDRIQAIESQIEAKDLATRITHGETATLEFKSSLRWNFHKKGFDKEIENAALKTIVAFCNTNGGELLIGIGPDGNILGLAHDGFSDPDKFQLHLRNLLVDRIVPNIIQFIDFKMMTLRGKTVCHVTCRISKKGVWLKPDKSSPEHFFVRCGPSSTELMPREAVEYIRDHFEAKENHKPTKEPTLT